MKCFQEKVSFLEDISSLPPFYCSLFLWVVYLRFSYRSLLFSGKISLKSKVKKPDSSSSMFLFLDCFGWLFGIFCVSIQILKFFCSNSVEDAIGNLIKIALNL